MHMIGKVRHRDEEEDKEDECWKREDEGSDYEHGNVVRRALEIILECTLSPIEVACQQPRAGGWPCAHRGK